MRTAILYSGGMRSFDKCLANHADQVHRHFPGADFYLSTVSDDDSLKSLDLKRRYPDHIKGLDILPNQPNFPLPPGCPPQWTPGKFYMHEPFWISASPAAILGQLWQLQNVWNQIPADKDYDCYIRIRPDIWFQEFELPAKLKLWLAPEPPGFSDGGVGMAWTPWWGRFGGIGDRFAILGAKAAEAYFTTFSAVDRLISEGAPLHPETLIKRQLEAEGCHINDTLRAVFGTLRTNGEMRQPEISAVDIAHAAMRG